MVVATKIDALDEPERLENLRELAEKDGKPFLQISAVTNQGTRELVNLVALMLSEITQNEAKEKIDVSYND